MDMAQKKNLSVKNEKAGSLDKEKATRLVITRIIIIIIADLLVASAFRFINTNANRQYYFHFNVLPVLKYVVAALVVISAAYWIITLVKKVDTSTHVMTPFMIFAFCMFLAVTVAFFDRFANTPFLFWTMIIVASVLFAVYYIYNILFYKK